MYLPTLFSHSSWGSYPVPENLPPPIIDDPALPLVSVVTPSYNQGQFIRATITSVLGQDYPNLEYWVLDGGSSDETLAILREYEGDGRFHWLSAPDRGQADAINKGWRRCRGDILAWLNSDDTYLPGAVRRQVAALQAHPECSAVYGDVLYTTAEGKPLYTFHGRPYDVVELVRLTVPMQPTTFLRRTIVGAIGPLNTEFRFSMDSEYWLRAARLAPFWYEPATVATYRLHQHSKTVGDYSGFYREWLAILERFVADFPAAAAGKRCWLYADLYAAIAATEMQRGSMLRGLSYVVRSLATGRVRPRLLSLLPALIDRVVPVNATPRFLEWISRRQSQHAAARSRPQ